MEYSGNNKMEHTNEMIINFLMEGYIEEQRVLTQNQKICRRNILYGYFSDIFLNFFSKFVYPLYQFKHGNKISANILSRYASFFRFLINIYSTLFSAMEMTMEFSLTLVYLNFCIYFFLVQCYTVYICPFKFLIEVNMSVFFLYLPYTYNVMGKHDTT